MTTWGGYERNAVLHHNTAKCKVECCLRYRGVVATAQPLTNSYSMYKQHVNSVLLKAARTQNILQECLHAEDKFALFDLQQHTAADYISTCDYSKLMVASAALP